MRVILSLVFLFAKDVRDVLNHVYNEENYKLGEPPTDVSLSPSASSGNSLRDKNSPSGAIKKTGLDENCNNECLVLQKQISDIFNMNPNNKAAAFFNSKCGSLTEGKFTKGLFALPICWCHSVDESGGHQRTLLLFCRYGIQMIKKGANGQTTTAKNKKRTSSPEMDIEEVNMATWGSKDRRSQTARVPNLNPRIPSPPNTPTSSSSISGGSSPKRPRTSSYPGLPGSAWTYAGPGNSTLEKRAGSSSSTRPQTAGSPSSSSSSNSSYSSNYERSPPDMGEEDFNTRPDDIPEGNTLWTYVRVGRDRVRAVVDTGSAFTIITQKYQGQVVPCDIKSFGSANGEAIPVEGSTTIDVEIRKGVVISVTGLVATMKKADIFFGSPFFDKYNAVIRIPERIMELTVDEVQVPMRVRYQTARKQISMTIGENGQYRSLRVSSLLNGKGKMMLVDTGASLTVVSAACVDIRTVRQDSTRMTVGNTPTTVLAKSNIKIGLGGNPPLATVTQEALIPDYYPTNELVAGNDFIRQYVQVIDYEEKRVYFRLPHPKRQYVSFSIEMYIYKPSS